jgi:hypothetical protein
VGAASSASARCLLDLTEVELSYDVDTRGWITSLLGLARVSSSWLVKLTSHRVSSARLVYELELARLAREPE